MKTPILPPNTRLATEDDFREDDHFRLGVEYFEWFLGVFKWERRFTDKDTDRSWLKIKIWLQYICVEDPEPVIYIISNDQVHV